MSTRRTPSTWAVPGADGSSSSDGFNLALHVGDDPARVLARRELLAHHLGTEPVWLDQVHGVDVLCLDVSGIARAARHAAPPPRADGSWTSRPGLACTVMVADCLPVLLAVDGARGVAALHAGWRGLCGPQNPARSGVGVGVLEVGVQTLCTQLGCAPAEVQAWLGPCIGPRAFEVGSEVLAGFGVTPSAPGPGFQPVGAGKWLASLPALARARLRAAGIERITGGHWCTLTDSARFFSFRRDRVTGRQAALIWLEGGRHP